MDEEEEVVVGSHQTSCSPSLLLHFLPVLRPPGPTQHNLVVVELRESVCASMKQSNIQQSSVVCSRQPWFAGRPGLSVGSPHLCGHVRGMCDAPCWTLSTACTLDSCCFNRRRRFCLGLTLQNSFYGSLRSSDS